MESELFKSIYKTVIRSVDFFHFFHSTNICPVESFFGVNTSGADAFLLHAKLSHWL